MKRQEGFTLLEILLALAILSALTFYIFNMVSGQIKVREKVLLLSHKINDIDASLKVLVNDLKQAFLLDVKQSKAANFDSKQVYPIFQYDEKQGALFWTYAFKSKIKNSPEGNMEQVFYHTKKNTDGSLSLIRSSDIVLNARVDTNSKSTVILKNVKTFRLAFWDGKSWSSTWDSEGSGYNERKKLPVLVKITLEVFKVQGKVGNLKNATVLPVSTVVRFLYSQGKKNKSKLTSSQGESYDWQ
jgi:general secretion pathway protein J